MKRNYIRNRYIFIFDVLSIIFATILAYMVVYTNQKPDVLAFCSTGGIYAICVFLTFAIFGVYNYAWCYSGTRELLRFLLINVIAVALMYAVDEILRITQVITYSHRRINFITALVSILSMTVIRMFSKELHKTYGSKIKEKSKVSDVRTSRVLIVGAGDACRIILNNISGTSGENMDVIGLIDDDKSKLGKVFFGKKVLGNRDDIIRLCDKLEIDKIILAIPTAYAKDRKEIIDICRKTKCIVRTIPGISELLESPEKEKIIRDIKIEDLLERDPVVLDNSGISALVLDKVIMITGGGGSIGSELCRQVMKYNPKKLIIVDIYENNAYDIQMELNEKYPDNKPVVLIASIRDKERLEEIFGKYHPEIVFHAAAHKHVPLMETSPREAVKNNVFGTYNLAITADKFGVKKFVMISTDKAVNPTNVMGASKRFCEMIIQCMENISSTEFVAVRFGNVLGSNGSVIPLFKRQIESGGPVRVTHEDVIRFFMTIPEAAQLVIQAACYAKGGEIFVLDMGKPVRIYDLAENIIRLSGYTPHVDIKIEIIGLRPGEKLYEELLMDSEGLESTQHKKIFIGSPKSIDLDELKEGLELLREAVESEDDNKVRDVFEKVVPTYIRDNVTFNENCKKQYDKVKVLINKKP
ncbi:MAG: polysaccharide biosynthesis protein [Ruminococcaceae bacterium]|nr:polysaccharide biosynthesis protein [Oscillospiraceae bacterium]